MICRSAIYTYIPTESIMTDDYFKTFTTCITTLTMSTSRLKWHFPGKASGNYITTENILKGTRLCGPCIISTNASLNHLMEAQTLIYFFSFYSILGFYVLLNLLNGSLEKFPHFQILFPAKAGSSLCQLIQVSRCSLKWNSDLRFQTCWLFQKSKTFMDVAKAHGLAPILPNVQPHWNLATPLLPS